MTAGDRNRSPVPYIALHIPSQITRRTPLRRRIAAMEQAANPINRKTAPNTMSVSWPRSIARSWSSNRPPPNTATIPDSMSTLMDVRLILEQDALARNRRSRADHGQSGSDSLLCLKSPISVIPSPRALARTSCQNSRFQGTRYANRQCSDGRTAESANRVSWKMDERHYPCKPHPATTVPCQGGRDPRVQTTPNLDLHLTLCGELERKSR